MITRFSYCGRILTECYFYLTVDECRSIIIYWSHRLDVFTSDIALEFID